MSRVADSTSVPREVFRSSSEVSTGNILNPFPELAVGVILWLFAIWMAQRVGRMLWLPLPVWPTLRRLVFMTAAQASKMTGRPIRKGGPFLGGTYVGRAGNSCFIRDEYPRRLRKFPPIFLE